MRLGAVRAAVTFGLLWLLAAGWSIGVPRHGAADTPSHMQKAAALVRGDLLGRSAAPLPEGFRLVRIPAAFGTPDITCYAYQPALAVWVVAVVLARGQGSIDRTSVTVPAVAGVALALTRPLSPAWLVVIVVAAGVLAERRRRGVLLRSRPVQITLLVLAVAGALQVAWTLLSGAISAPDPRLAVDAPFSTVARLAIGDSADQLHQLVGSFGWLDTPAPALTVVLWLVLLGTALLVAGRRELAVLGSLVLVVIALPIVADIQQAAATGLVWQGRYTLPVAMGVPIVAAAWEPPVPPLLLLVGYGVGWAALGWWLLGRGRLTLFEAAPTAVAAGTLTEVATEEPARNEPEASTSDAVTVPG